MCLVLQKPQAKRKGLTHGEWAEGFAGGFLEEPGPEQGPQGQMGSALQEEGTSCPKTRLWKGEQQRVTEHSKRDKCPPGWPQRS